MRVHELAKELGVRSKDILSELRDLGTEAKSHMSKLEDAGLIEVKKDFVDRKPMTLLSITDKGREILVAYRERMKRFLDQI